jgi:hypothetical protein
MADRTKRFRFTVLNAPADRLDSGNYKFSDADRVLLDRLLTRAIEHNHTGIQVEADRYAPPALTVSTTGGALPPNRGVYYRYAIVDRTGQEFVASPIVTLFTPTQVSAPPFAPRLSTEQSGSLEEGTYVYALSACTGDNRQETLLSPTASITTAGVGGCRVDFPPPPSGAEFFNVYRQGPREPELLYLTTMGPDDRYLVEDGNNRTDPLRTSPQANTTHTANSVQITLPADVLPAGGSWKLYRSYDPAHWDNSLLDWIGAFASYIDDGRATRAGVPPESSAAVGGAPKIRLGIDTTGTPPPTVLNATSHQVMFNADRAVEGPGNWYWVNEYDWITLLGMQATIGRGKAPDLQDIEVALEMQPTWTNQNWSPIINSPIPATSVIAVGETIGSRCTIGSYSFGPGTKLRLNVLAQGHSDMLSPQDLTVVLTFMARDDQSPSTSYVWETT